jgi:small subunit ribosomal protein S15
MANPRLIQVQLKARLQFTTRINHLTQHLLTNKKDYSTQRALLKLVGKRRKLLDYLKEKDIERYRAIIKALKIRK